MDRAGATETHIEFVKVPGNKVTFENLEVATPTGCTMLSEQYVEIALGERLPSECRIPLRIKRSQIHILLAAALAALGACAPLAKVNKTEPKLGAQYGRIAELRRAEQAIAGAQKLKRTDPNRAVGFYLCGLEAAAKELRKNPRDRLALRDYDFALSRVFSIIRDAHLDPWTHPLHVPAPGGGEYVLTQRPAANRLWKPQAFDLIPADELNVRGKFVVPRVTRQGIGASLVAVRTQQAPSIRQRFVPPRIYLAVTALAYLSGRKYEIKFIDPLSVETASLSGRSLPSGADFTAPLALGLSRERPEKIGLPAMLDPERFANTARLTQVQPYDPQKIPVLFVHGLQGTPVTWVPMVNTIWADPVLRRNYQIWVFSYPSGYPIPYSASLLRRELDALNKTFPNHRQIVLVGHSMGGILSRLMITDSGGDKVWRYFFGKLPAQTKLSPESKALVKETLVFKRRRDVARVIFISTPHRGSLIAESPIGRIASRMIHKSVEFERLGPEILQASVVQEDPGVMKLKRMPNSIDTLSPNDPFVKIMNALPLAKGVPYHSIIGDRGRGDTPNSSDGVVPYWSSHVGGAKSEQIVPSDHGANQNPKGIAEVVRILREHLESKGSVTKRQPRISREGMLNVSENFRPFDVRFQGKPDRLSCIPGVNVAPEVPSAFSGIILKTGESGIIVGFHDVRKTQADNLPTGDPNGKTALPFLRPTSLERE